MAFFRIEMTDNSDGPLHVQCFQAGEQLNFDRFKPADFNLTLLDEQGERFIASKISYNEFSPSLVVENAQLKGAKTFILIVDVMWNKIAR